MTLNLRLSEATLARLQNDAARKGLNVDDYASALLENFANAAPQEKPFYETATTEEWVKAFTEWAESHHYNLPVLPEEAFSRESMYEDERL